MAIVGDRIEHRTYKDGLATIVSVNNIRGEYTVEWDKPKGLRRAITFQEYALHWKLISARTGSDPKVVVVDSSNGTRCYHTWHKITLFRFDTEECSKCGVLRE